MINNPISKAILITSVCVGLGACSPTVQQRGNMLKDYQLEEVVVGVHTKSDILRILGSPTTISPFNEDIWYYIGQETEKRSVLDAEIKEERIVIVAFNEEGSVTTINETDGERIDIPIERSKTPTHGNDITIMQQLLGNLGKFNPKENAGN